MSIRVVHVVTAGFQVVRYNSNFFTTPVIIGSQTCYVQGGGQIRVLFWM